MAPHEQNEREPTENIKAIQYAPNHFGGCVYTVGQMNNSSFYRQPEKRVQIHKMEKKRRRSKLQ